MEPTIEKIQPNDSVEIIEVADIVFPQTIGFNKSYIGSYLKREDVLDISIKLVAAGKIVGFYIFAPEPLSSRTLQTAGVYDIVDQRKGVEGIALGILPEYRDKGIGKKLINYPYTLTHFDYIWGQHFKHLNNIDDWKKRRKIVDELGDIFISVGLLRTPEEKDIVFTHYHQTEGWNCGPTALYIAYKPMKIYKDITIEEVSKMCGADNILGTTDERMKKGLDALNISYLRSPNLPFDDGAKRGHEVSWLKAMMRASNVFLLRGLVKGIKHWVVVTKYDTATNKFHILDPWLGEYDMDEDELIAIWEPRDFDGFILYKENYE